MKPISMATVRGGLMAAQQEEVRDVLHGRSVIRVWGLTRGARGAGERGWTRLELGDIGLFARDARYFARCSVIGKVRSPHLGNRLWPRPEGGQPFEFIYFIDDVRAIDIPYEEFNRAIESAPNRVPLGFVILDPIESMLAINAFGLME